MNYRNRKEGRCNSKTCTVIAMGTKPMGFNLGIYTDFLSTKVFQAVHAKFPFIRGIPAILQQNNTRPHTSQQQWSWPHLLDTLFSWLIGLTLFPNSIFWAWELFIPYKIGNRNIYLIDWCVYLDCTECILDIQFEKIYGFFLPVQFIFERTVKYSAGNHFKFYIAKTTSWAKKE